MVREIFAKNIEWSRGGKQVIEQRSGKAYCDEQSQHADVEALRGCALERHQKTDRKRHPLINEDPGDTQRRACLEKMTNQRAGPEVETRVERIEPEIPHL